MPSKVQAGIRRMAPQKAAQREAPNTTEGPSLPKRFPIDGLGLGGIRKLFPDQTRTQNYVTFFIHTVGTDGALHHIRFSCAKQRQNDHLQLISGGRMDAVDR